MILVELPNSDVCRRDNLNWKALRLAKGELGISDSGAASGHVRGS
jgi:hypothetical protein